MSRITKTIAEQVAIKLTEKKSYHLEVLKAQLEDLATNIKIGYIPTDVLKAYRKNSKYFKSCTSEYFRGPGLGHYESFRYNQSLPHTSEGVKVNELEAQSLIQQRDKIEDLQNTINKIKLDVENALLALRTYNNVEKEFPEAFEHLPSRTTTALSININDVRKQLA
ncbi:MAG TPA: hypothetical protein VD794_02120 [Flavisolibacter sp.]|nr:hypothetical protein [Flavisolibacter sp.]